MKVVFQKLIGCAGLLRHSGDVFNWAGSILDLGTVNDWCMLVWVVMMFGGEGVVKFEMEICNVIFHRETAVGLV